MMKSKVHQEYPQASSLHIDLISRIIVLPILPGNMVASTKNMNPQNLCSLQFYITDTTSIQLTTLPILSPPEQYRGLLICKKEDGRYEEEFGTEHPRRFLGLPHQPLETLGTRYLIIPTGVASITAAHNVNPKNSRLGQTQSTQRRHHQAQYRATEFR
jgi:hypothetical protein